MHLCIFACRDDYARTYSPIKALVESLTKTQFYRNLATTTFSVERIARVYTKVHTSVSSFFVCLCCCSTGGKSLRCDNQKFFHNYISLFVSFVPFYTFYKSTLSTMIC